MILDLYLKFKPLEKFSHFEVWPCTEDSDHNVEQCEPEEAHFWSVYICYNSGKEDSPETIGGLDCICDCDTEQQAEEVKDFLTNLCNNYNGKS